jgi:hypothetical protein
MTCLYCSGNDDLVGDHLVPRSRGGLNLPENIVRACRSCNARKRDRLPSEWRSDLLPAVYELERRVLALHPKVPPRRKDTKPMKIAVVSVSLAASQKRLFETAAAREGLGPSTWLLRLGLMELARQQGERR